MARAVSNPPNPWCSTHVEYLGEVPEAALEVYEEEAKSILSKNDSPDLPFRYSVNPYRGCYHGCAYCYARPTHEYLGWGAGTDFDRKIVVKTNAPELLSMELGGRKFGESALHFSGNTDCYQPLEACYELTRRCLEVCLVRATPVVVITKGALVRRDADILGKLAARVGATVIMSIPFVDANAARAIEPHAATPTKRFECLRVLSDAGVAVGVSISPVIPGLNDEQIAPILEQAARNGAQSAFMTMLRLSGPVRDVFYERLEQAFPGRASKVRNAIREMRLGADTDSRFFRRMGGTGERWNSASRMFEVQCRRLGLALEVGSTSVPGTRRSLPSQGDLFA